MINFFAGLVVGSLVTWLLMWDQADKRRYEHFMQSSVSGPTPRMDEGLTARNNNGPGPTTHKPDIIATPQRSRMWFGNGAIYITGNRIDYVGDISPEARRAFAMAWDFQRIENQKRRDV